MSKKQTIAIFLTLLLTPVGNGLIDSVQAEIIDNIERVADKMAPSDRAVVAVMDAGQKQEAITNVDKLESAMRTSSALAPRGAGLELNEISEPRDLLIDSEHLRTLLGTIPAFVYSPGATPDPMIVPWSRARVLTAELLHLAEQAQKSKKWDIAEDLYLQVLEIAESLDSAGLHVPIVEKNSQIAQAGLKEVAIAQESETATLNLKKRKVQKLPPKIRNNTIGILYDPADPVCIVGNDILHVGDIVPDKSVEVFVDKITPNTVHYKIYDQVFIVDLAEKESQ